MRKVVLLEHVSLDGFLAGPQGEMDWIVAYNDFPAADVKRLGAETIYDNSARGSVGSIKGLVRDQASADAGGVRT